MNYTFIRFLIVGIANTVVGLSAIYIILHIGGYSYWTATFLGNLIGACLSFYLNKSFTFKSDNPIFRSMIKFALVILFCYFLSYNLGKNLVDWLLFNNTYLSSGIRTDISVLVSTGLYTVLNYICQRLIVFPLRTTERT